MAGVPVAYSAGFTPHPKISYSGGAPTGSASEAEFLEISLTRRCEPADVGQWLDAALPDGIDVVDVVEADQRSAALLEASEWEVIWPGVAPDAADLAAQAFLDAPAVEVERLTSKGLRRLDARAAVLSLRVAVNAGRRVGEDPAAGCAILRMVVRHMEPTVRPDDLMTALCQFPPLAPAGSAGPVRPVPREAAARVVPSHGSPRMPPRAARFPSEARYPGETQRPPGSARITRLWQGPLGDVATARASATLAAEVDSAARGGSESGPADPARGRNARRAMLLTDQTGDPGATECSPAAPASQAGHHQDRTVRPQAGSATIAPAGRVRVDEQLLRGAPDQLPGLRAREPYGRDCPDARNRATEPTVRYQ